MAYLIYFDKKYKLINERINMLIITRIILHIIKILEIEFIYYKNSYVLLVIY